MKRYYLIPLALGLCAGSLDAQTADQYVTAGRSALTATNLAGAYSNFNAAVSLSPSHPAANALAGFTRILLLPQKAAINTFLTTRLGVSTSGRDLLNWTADFQRDASGNIVLPAGLASTDIISLYSTAVVPDVLASIANLAQITDTNFSLSLTPAETHLDAVTLDYGDVVLMRAFLHAADFAGHTLNAHNFYVYFDFLKSLVALNQLSVQTLLANYPSLLTQSSQLELFASKGPFTNAILRYLEASAFIRNVRPTNAPALFVLAPEKAGEEANFRAAATVALASVNQPVLVNSNDTDSVYAGAYFAGTKSLRSLVPQFNGNHYVYNSLPDYTFGGVLLDLPACDTEAALRQKLSPTYAGVYSGYVWGSGGQGQFAAFVSANNQATVLGYGFGTISFAPSGLFVQFPIADDGSWSVSTNGISGSGSVSKAGFITGDLVTSAGSFSIDGSRVSDSGPFKAAAGGYTGTWSGAGKSGKVWAVLGADGTTLYTILDSANNIVDEGTGAVDVQDNTFSSSSENWAYLVGKLNVAAFSLTGGYTNVDSTTGTFTLSRAASVQGDTPPTITVSPKDQTMAYGQNATFSVTAAGSAPLCYQWFSNNVPISKATAATLVVSNVKPGNNSTLYSVQVRNLAGATNSPQAVLYTVPSTTAPVLALSSPIAGQRIGTALAQVTGTSRDNAQVAFVQCQVNGGAWVPATTTNGWTNWTASIPLTAGPNTVCAYAQNTSGFNSPTNSVSFTYVVSAPLVMSMNGGGSLSPNYNGTMLEIGKSFTTWAYPAYGFVFSNWTGSASTTSSMLTFTMASNLNFTANFVDITRPYLYISSPYYGQRWASNAQFTVTGTASDNDRVAAVWVQANGGGWVQATGTASWQATVPLVPGPNTIRACAVDPAGNFSLTNSVPCNYVLSAPLAVSMTGKGSVYPSYNGAMLEVGQPFTMWAYPGYGFAFTNWTGSLNTNTYALAFHMASNLTFTANFVDVQRPYLYISSPYWYQRWLSNAQFTVAGTASDNDQVATVWCRANSNAWVKATGTGTWQATVPLVPGPNTVQAYAVDATGNCSLTSSVPLTYVLSAPLTVNLNGKGTVYPNYNGAFLEVGQPYTMWAYPGWGCVFTNWTGSINTNTSALSFRMASNLTFTANFIDVQAPSLYFTSPYYGQRTTNGTVTVSGNAYDNDTVAAVWCQANSNAWVKATGTNSWTASLNLTPGVNTLRAYAVDATGNRSLTNSTSATFVVMSLLTLRTNGIGVIYPGFYGNSLEVGQSYYISAYPGVGQVFSNWVGSLTTNTPMFYFKMQSNMVLQANFVTNMFLAAYGTYNGLFAVDPANRVHENSGFFTLYVGQTGYYSANFQMGGQYYYLSGQFDASGSATATVLRYGTTPLTVTLTLNLGSGADQLAGTISDGTWVASLSADKAIYNGWSSIAPSAGNYTMIIPGSTNTSGPVTLGDGYATLSVGAGGYVSMSGYLADSTYLYQFVPVSGRARWPLYQSLYAGKGSLWGWMYFATNQPPDDVYGGVSWIKEPVSWTTYYPGGLTNTVLAEGSHYTAIYTNRAIAVTNAVLTFEGDNFGGAFTNRVTLGANNLVSNNSTNYLYMYLSVWNGTFSGTVVQPGTTRYLTFQGALFQNANTGYGYVLGTNHSGEVFLGAP